MSQGLFTILPDRGAVRVAGAEARDFLQRLITADLDKAAAMFKRRGWISKPSKYHRTPPKLNDADVLHWSTHNGPLRHESMSFTSEFDARSFELGADRWPGNDRNHTVTVRLLRRPDSPAPWVVILHGFGMGSSRFDLNVLWANFLHHKLGYNVALPISPLHGPRRESADGQLLSLDLTSMLHGITQAVWDVRRLVSWIRSTTDAPVGLYGVSLGGYLSTVLAGLERFDAVAAALPFQPRQAPRDDGAAGQQRRPRVGLGGGDRGRHGFQVVAVVVDDARRDGGERGADRARAAAGDVERVAHAHADLRHPEALQRHRARDLLPPRRQRHRPINPRRRPVLTTDELPEGFHRLEATMTFGHKQRDT